MDFKRVFKAVRNGQIPPPGELPPFVLDLVAEVASLRGRFSRLSAMERVLAALKNRRPDRVPFTPLVCSGGRALVDVSFPDYAQKAESGAEVFSAVLDFIGGDLLVLLWDLSIEAGDFGQKMVFPEQSTPHPDYNDPLIKSVDDYKKVSPIAFKDASRMQEFVKLCRIMVERAGMRALVTGFVYGPLGVLSMMRGNKEFFKDCVNYPNEIIPALEVITETLIEYVEAQCDAGVPAVALDTLYSSHSGISKDLWNRLEAPFARQIADAIRKKGAFVGIHNCGHGPYFDAILKATEAGVFSFAHLPDDCRTKQELKEKYGRDVVLIGYLNTPMLSYANPYEVMRECRRQIDALGSNGGYILAPGCEYPPNISLINALSIAKAAYMS